MYNVGMIRTDEVCKGGRGGNTKVVLLIQNNYTHSLLLVLHSVHTYQEKQRLVT
jgi:hypothetical protein